MKLYLSRLLLLALNLYPLAVLAQHADHYPYPPRTPGHVTDHAGMLSKKEKEQVEGWLRQAEVESGVEIIIVTIRSLDDYEGAANNSIEEFATGLFNAYGVGNLPKNDGVLLVISAKDREARIELGKHYGYARDRDAKRIMDTQIIPRFKKADYGGGIVAGAESLIEEFASIRVTFPWEILGIAVGGVACLLIGVSCFINGKRGWGYVFVGIAIILVLLAIYFAIAVLTSSGSGEGGGSSGGGGASGSW